MTHPIVPNATKMNEEVMERQDGEKNGVKWFFICFLFLINIFIFGGGGCWGPSKQLWNSWNMAGWTAKPHLTTCSEDLMLLLSIALLIVLMVNMSLIIYGLN